MNLSKESNTRSKDQTMKTRPCHFPGCKVEFLGRGKTKYCEEHRKQKYKKILYKKNVSDGIGDSNVQIKHKNLVTTKIIKECGLDGCSNVYGVILIPNQYIYSNYCHEHRNEFKRKLFLKKKEHDDEI